MLQNSTGYTSTRKGMASADSLLVGRFQKMVQCFHQGLKLLGGILGLTASILKQYQNVYTDTRRSLPLLLQQSTLLLLQLIASSTE